jgi:predicted RNA-binding Zn-ribbon protein involved in translation (DUF1610 family)
MDGAFLSAHSMDDERNQTTVIFACPKCGLAHEVTQEHVPAKMSGGFDCVDCGATIHSWYGVFDYSGCKAVRMDRGRGNAASILRLKIRQQGVLVMRKGTPMMVFQEKIPPPPAARTDEEELKLIAESIASEDGRLKNFTDGLAGIIRGLKLK